MRALTALRSSRIRKGSTCGKPVSGHNIGPENVAGPAASGIETRLNLVNALKKNDCVRTLVVDDSAAVRTSLSSLLDAHHSLEVVGTAENGREAVAKVEELSPDLVLMDLQMPEMNGLDATKSIRRRRPAVRVIVITMHDSGGVRAACRRAGANGFVSKTAGIHEILDEIRRVLEHPSQGNGDE